MGRFPFLLSGRAPTTPSLGRPIKPQPPVPPLHAEVSTENACNRPTLKTNRESAPVVIIDDNLDDLELLYRLLVKAGVRNPITKFQCATTAFEFLKKIGAPDLSRAVITDGEMPGTDGFALIRSLRALPQFSAARLIMVSGTDRPQAGQRALEAGAGAFIQKFPSAERLTRALQN